MHRNATYPGSTGSSDCSLLISDRTSSG